MYSRNRIYVSPNNQQQIKKCRLLIAGAGLGSVISECALRLGFENITLIDFDKVELSNLNRQNYTNEDVGTLKAEAIVKRLRSINPLATINYHPVCLGENNLENYVRDFDIAINTIDFASNAPFLFDEYCLTQKKVVLHPFNLGWAGCVFVMDAEGKKLGEIDGIDLDPEKSIVRHILSNTSDLNTKWLERALEDFERETCNYSPPQLAVASWITAGICTKIAFDYAIENMIRTFPDFYILSVG